MREKPEEYEKFALRDDPLFKLISVGNNQPLMWVQCVPKECREAALREAHDVPTSGHGGNVKSFHRLRRKYYWPKMHQEVKEYVKACSVCHQQKMERVKPAGMLGSSP